jgi:hypothetical protein
MEQWRIDYNTMYPLRSLSWNSPAPESLLKFDELSILN